MERHVKTLAIANIIYGFVGGLLSLLVLLITGGFGDVYAWGDAFGGFGPLALGLVAFHLITAIPGIAVGVGLLNYNDSARMGGIVLCAANLLNIPIGSVLGIYGLWALLTPESEPLFLDPMLKRRQIGTGAHSAGHDAAADTRRPLYSRIKHVRTHLQE
jgi:hypothetical protein